MNPTAQTQLREIGLQLDAGTYPQVFNDGVLAPRRSFVDVATLGAENTNERQRSSRSAAGSRQRAAGWQGSAGGSRQAGEAQPPGSGTLRKNYLGQLDDVLAAYPQTTWWMSDRGMWLSVESSVLAGLDRRATFLIAVPFQRLSKIKAWAFWTNAVSHEWIGPRHTNSVDGSICAFNPCDFTWRGGGSLVELIDQYTMWVFRHLHLSTFGWWPGEQTTQFVYERLTEVQDNEWCGCGRQPTARYRDCCKETDLNADRFRAALEFVGGFLKFKPRQPPEAVVRFLRQRADPPEFEERTIAPALSCSTSLSVRTSLAARICEPPR